MTNFDQIKGKVKETAGEAADNDSLANKGRADRAKGKAKEGADKAKDRAKKAAGEKHGRFAE
ncbi:CsbD family protein [Streptosporangium sp. NBC_01639]|uniref:CsbD family protein n=1 Tax=unclassified Streptosporangium TaxID=2632669 RepID=UPI002DDBD103|nr:CsbD family protein [Streptosporangium sp. NBC_01756]WSC85583.1 CsbD family protein [Streptosporangium sp. NBC_01756]WTD55742.1 CsbD family protein [Streptosporangium sp. NBC_01639]